MIRKPDALKYHSTPRTGKLEVKATKPCLSPREMRLAYLPGASFPAAEILQNAAATYEYTARGNLVAVVTNGTAVPGLGDAGPYAAKPMQEGIAVLFKRLADIDVFDLELDERNPARFVEAVRILEPTFGGINLKDLRAPEGLEIYDRLRATMRIPVFHENLYSTAVVAMAALMNALELVDKKLVNIRVTISGAGTVALGCARLLVALGASRENLLLYDRDGLIHPSRADLNPYQREYARDHAASSLEDGLRGADVFLGASAGGVLSQAMIRTMAPFPIVFAMATPEPEISYESARESRRDVIVATSLGQDPNAIVDLLSFPYIFRGALDVQAASITEGMMLAAARALAELAREDVVEEVSRAYGYETFHFGPEYLLPKPVDPRILIRESTAVARQAIQEGVARRPVELDEYEEALHVRIGTGREILRHLVLKARQRKMRIVFAEGANESVLRACGILMDEGLASPILLGTEPVVRAAAEKIGVDLGGAIVTDPLKSPRFDHHVQEYFRLRGRRGVTPEMAQHRMVEPKYFGAMMLHAGDADMMICGMTSHFSESMSTVLEVIGPAPGVHRICSLFMVCRMHETYFLADCSVNIDPAAEELAETALLTASMVRSLSIEPRVAMLSFSNFGSADHPLATKVREATRIAQEQAPDLIIDGEIQLATALSAEIRHRYFPFSHLDEDANVLIFPDLQSGNLALHMLQKMGDSILVGPVLLGTRLPVHVVQHGTAAEDLVRLAVIGIVTAPRA